MNLQPPTFQCLGWKFTTRWSRSTQTYHTGPYSPRYGVSSWGSSPAIMAEFGTTVQRSLARRHSSGWLSAGCGPPTFADMSSQGISSSGVALRCLNTCHQCSFGEGCNPIASRPSNNARILFPSLSYSKERQFRISHDSQFEGFQQKKPPTFHMLSISQLRTLVRTGDYLEGIRFGSYIDDSFLMDQSADRLRARLAFVLRLLHQ